MLIWSRHNRPGPAVAQSPHNNPPRPRLSPLLPLPAARPAQSRTPRSAEPSSAPPPVSLRSAGRFRPPAEEGWRGKRGRGGEAPRAGGPGNPHRALPKSPQRRGRLAGFLPRGRSGARAEARARERDSLPSPSGRNASSVRKGRRDPRRRSQGSSPPFSERVVGRPSPSGNAALCRYCDVLAAAPASSWGRAWPRCGRTVKQGGVWLPRPSRPENQTRSSRAGRCSCFWISELGA